MKKIQWLLSLADGKPLLFSIALLLIAVITLSTVVISLQKELHRCHFNEIEIQGEYSRRTDSIAARYDRREMQLNDEVKSQLSNIILNYKQQLEEQKHINNEITNTIIKNQKLISTTRVKTLK